MSDCTSALPHRVHSASFGGAVALFGGEENDRLIGDTGAVVLSGDAGGDVIDIADLLESGDVLQFRNSADADLVPMAGTERRIDSDGRVGEFRIQSVATAPGFVSRTLASQLAAGNLDINPA